MYVEKKAYFWSVHIRQWWLGFIHEIIGTTLWNYAPSEYGYAWMNNLKHIELFECFTGLFQNTGIEMGLSQVITKGAASFSFKELWFSFASWILWSRNGPQIE